MIWYLFQGTDDNAKLVLLSNHFVSFLYSKRRPRLKSAITETSGCWNVLQLRFWCWADADTAACTRVEKLCKYNAKVKLSRKWTLARITADRLSAVPHSSLIISWLAAAAHWPSADWPPADRLVPSFQAVSLRPRSADHHTRVSCWGFLRHRNILLLIFKPLLVHAGSLRFMSKHNAAALSESCTPSFIWLTRRGSIDPSRGPRAQSSLRGSWKEQSLTH